MELGIRGKVAAVTGGARGIGRASAVEFAREGCQVALLDISEENLEAAMDEVTRVGARAHALRLDVSDADAVREAAAEVNTILGPPAILVNSAAVLDNFAVIDQMDQARWERDLAVNLTGVFNCIRAFLPGMKEERWGRIVNISSVAGLLGGFGQAGYAATKAGLLGLTKTVALEGARHNITANVIWPGLVGTESVALIREDMRERIAKRSVWRKVAEPADAGKVICFLCSEPARYITGIALDFSGGMSLFTY
jgi:3-oxoacyl-[acyl-carrier protein] reductase